MKKNIKIFLLVNFLCGICTFSGSVLGKAFSETALFTGALAGGITGIFLSAYILMKIKVIEPGHVLPLAVWGILFFLSASLFAVTNLNSPVIPLLSLCCVGIGALIGNTYEIRKGQSKNFYCGIGGFLLMLPALYFVIGSIVRYNLEFAGSFTLLEWFQQTPSRKFYFNLISPVVFIGGAVLCILINISFRWKSNQKMNYPSVNIVSVPRVNLMMAVTSILLLTAIGIYVLLENSQPF